MIYRGYTIETEGADRVPIWFVVYLDGKEVFRSAVGEGTCLAWVDTEKRNGRAK